MLDNAVFGTKSALAKAEAIDLLIVL